MKKTNCALPMLEKLAEEGNWDQVFYCLGIDPNGFFELSKVSDDSWNKFDWLREHQETMKMLTTALHVIQINVLSHFRREDSTLSMSYNAVGFKIHETVSSSAAGLNSEETTKLQPFMYFLALNSIFVPVFINEKLIISVNIKTTEILRSSSKV
uniref:Uncharacterized protein n=1 Tax=Glossina pallidipes TaxID=7398 RepID=A0A1A9ZXC6_GLOPL